MTFMFMKQDISNLRSDVNDDRRERLKKTLCREVFVVQGGYEEEFVQGIVNVVTGEVSIY